MEHWQGRVVLVTGASAGIGACTAETLAKLGMKVVGCARNMDRLQKLAEKLEGEKGTFHPIKCDLSKEEDILGMFAEVSRLYGGVDVLINNAGFNFDTSLLDGDTAHWRQILDAKELQPKPKIREGLKQVDVLAVAICSREAVKSMRTRNVDDGHIIHLNSICGHVVSQRTAHHFYCMAKFAVRAHLEGLRHELRELKSHIRATEISPGAVETEFATRCLGEERGRKFYSQLKCLEAKDITDAVIYALSAPPHVQVHDILIYPTDQ